MLYRLAAALLITLSISLHAAPSSAQRRTVPGDSTRGDRVRETVETVRRIDRQRSEEARAWASRRGFPTRLRQRDGSVVQITGTYGLRPTYITTHNRQAALLTGTQHVFPGERLGLNLTGKGLLLGIWDGGHVLAEHREFTGRVRIGDSSSPTSDDHATHVAGTLIASGLSFDARGMAYEANLSSYDWDADVTEMEREARNGLLLSNHSYGEIAGWYYGDLEDTGVDQWYWLSDPTISRTEDHVFGRYGEYAFLYDGVAYSHPHYLPVVAAGNDRGEPYGLVTSYRGLDAQGNWQTYDVTSRPPPDGGTDGFDTIAGSATAKNILTVGSVGLDRNGNPVPSSFSSYGPTDDGRIKPDIVGYGERVYSTRSLSSDSYGTKSGTSMATPNITGSLLLLQQYHFLLTGRYMTAASLKGLVLHTARDLDTPGPDYKTGWGLLDMEAAARVLSDVRANPLAVLESELADGERFSRTATVSAGGPVRVTLSWTDPAKRQNSAILDDPTPQLVNDLDVRLVNQRTGDVYRPYTLDPRNPSQPASVGDNTVDPIEQIFLPDAPAGSYSIEVTHKGRLAGNIPQPFSLIVTGATDATLPVIVFQSGTEASVDEVKVQWQTSIERSPGQFRIERIAVTIDPRGNTVLSAPEVVARIATEGTPQEGRSYEFSDERLLAGKYLHRIYYESPEIQYLAAEVETQVLPPSELGVLYSYPNPFTDRTNLILDLPYRQSVRLEIHDALGRRVAVLVDEQLAAGRHELPVDASNWAAGLYFARVTADGHVITHRMVHVR